MTALESSIGKRKTDSAKRRRCSLHIINRSGSTLNLVIQGTEVGTVRAMTIRRRKRIRLIKGTYVVEMWLSSGRIIINPVNIPHISIEKITTRPDVSIRGRKIVADFINDRAKLVIASEASAVDML